MKNLCLLLIGLIMMACQSTRPPSDEEEVISFVLKCASSPYSDKVDQSELSSILTPELYDMTTNRRPSTKDTCEHLDDFNWFMATQEADLEASRLEEFKRLDLTTFQVTVATYYKQNFRQKISYIVERKNKKCQIRDIIYESGKKRSDICVESGAQRKVNY